MEHCKISKPLNDSTVLKFATKKKWIKVNDLLGGQYSTSKNIRFKTPMLRSDLCDYRDAYIAVRGTINLKVDENNDMPKKMLHLKKMHHLGHA